ncbi:MAG TPA: hypothetical protein VK400_16915 [Pyrinomonadaceae bacterium]|nr:hypothetical protein [Pyrinomonadaceae bacterium]
MKVIRKFFCFCLLTLVAFASISQASCSGVFFQSKQKQAIAIIEKIEGFKVKENRLPNSLSEIGVAETEEGPIYYRKISETRYEVWYGTKLGESVTYDSERKTWE